MVLADITFLSMLLHLFTIFYYYWCDKIALVLNLIK